MSWRDINRMLGLAMMDSVFAERLLKEPQETLNRYGIELQPEELTVLCSCHARTIPELSQQLVEKLFPEKLQ